MKRLALVLCTVTVATPVLGNSLVTPGPQANIAGSSLSASPSIAWNRLSRRDGKNTEVWTIDGDQLNKIVFYGGIAVGQPLMREVDKKNQPPPRVTANMLITDIPALLEQSYRSKGNVVQMSIDSQEPTLVAGYKGIHFSYSFVRQDDEVQRRGEAVGAVVKNKLYLVTYEAPALHFFDADVEQFRQLASTLKL